MLKPCPNRWNGLYTGSMRILIIALHKNERPISACYELIQAAKAISGDLHTVVLAENATSPAQELAKRGSSFIAKCLSND